MIGLVYPEVEAEMGEVDEEHGQKDSALDRVPSVEEEDQQKQHIFHIPRVAARTITGPANLQNQNAIDWGHHGLLAYGSNYTVVVIDTKNIQPVQCLDKHKSMVNHVLWGNNEQVQPVAEPVVLTLASSDTTGHIILWNVAMGIAQAVLQEGNKPVLDMKWVSGFDCAQHLLAALHPPYSLIIWDTLTRTKLWKKTYTETLVSFSFDPFSASRMAFLCSDCILFVDDFMPSKIPSSNGRKFYISSPRIQPSVGSSRGSMSNLTSVGLEEKHRTKDRLRRLMKDLVVGETKPRPDDCMMVSECLQLCYHSAARHHLLLLYAREILVLDLHINQTVGIIPVEKTASPLVQVISARQRDVLYCLHESGSVSAKFRRRQLGFIGSPLDAPAGSISSVDMGSFSNDVFLELSYEQRCQSEVIRQTKGSKILGMCVSPVCERRIALFMNTGKVVFLELRPGSSESLFPLVAGTEASPPARQLGLSGLGQLDACQHRAATLQELVRPLAMDYGPQLPPLRLLVTGLLTGAASPLTVIRMCPPLTTRNWQKYTPLMAAGTSEGIVQVYNMALGVVDKELMVHSSVVRGIEWTNLTSFISFAHPNVTGSGALVHNELMLTDTLTGSSLALRVDKADEPPIDMVRVSPLKQYFVVILKDGPFELWDLRNLSILRVMPKKFPAVTALEWSPIHNLKSLKKKLASVEEKEQAEPANIAVNTSAGDIGRADGQDKHLVAREHFVFSDSESQLYHFSVEGNLVRDGIKIPPEAGVGTVTCIAFKNDQIVQGDVDGMLNIWDLKARTSKNIHTGRGWIKKMRFAPGKGNLKMLILYSDGVDVVDLKKQYDRISQLKCPKDMVKVLDIDWAASDKPVLATQDGCLRIMDMTLSSSVSPIMDYEFQDPVYCPLLLHGKTIVNLRLLLAGQFWKDSYSLKFTTQDGFTEQQLEALQEQLDVLDDDLDYLEHCPKGTAERSLIAAQFFGDQSDVDFWTVALYYLQVAKLESKYGKVAAMGGSTESETVSMSSPSVLDTKRINRYPSLQPLDTCYDVLCEPYTYQCLQLERVSLHESKRGDYQHTRKVIEQLILLGEMDRAVQLLLETELDNPNYYTDAIKACLVATIQSTGAAQSTIKLVATNLIANGNIWEGVQLLCLIGKGLDACRYLVSYNMWEQAVWLAKAVLPQAETREVMRKWADRLWANDQKNKAVLVVLSLGQFDRVLEMLGVQRLHGKAALLLQACKEFGLLPAAAAHEPLVTAVQLDAARLLFSVGNHRAALTISQRLGPAGEKLHQEFRILSEET
ncbi:WD repeat-containing protein 11-like [Bacillus rossius redtenbacheri]|uniref:WD repeat-containing protein 11-like n=1 Tax=Bacillus rossius redtenbacheri TaxID=93214 RepID=UPI002FDD6B34